MRLVMVKNCNGNGASKVHVVLPPISDYASIPQIFIRQHFIKECWPIVIYGDYVKCEWNGERGSRILCLWENTPPCSIEFRWCQMLYVSVATKAISSLLHQRDSSSQTAQNHSPHSVICGVFGYRPTKHPLPTDNPTEYALLFLSQNYRTYTQPP